MKKNNLLQIKSGQKVRIAAILGGIALENKMMTLGIYPGREITKIGHIALRGPVTVKVGRSVIALGHGMAAKIIVDSL